MPYIGKNRALKRITAYFKGRGYNLLPIEHTNQNTAFIQELIEHTPLLEDEFPIYYFETIDNQTILLSSKTIFIRDKLLLSAVVHLEDIQDIKFNFNFKSELEAPHLISIILSDTQFFNLLMSDGPQGIALVNAIQNIRSRLYI